MNIHQSTASNLIKVLVHKELMTMEKAVGGYARFGSW
jgi:hypothetical protein